MCVHEVCPVSEALHVCHVCACARVRDREGVREGQERERERNGGREGGREERERRERGERERERERERECRYYVVYSRAHCMP